MCETLLHPNQVKVVEFYLKLPRWGCNQLYGKYVQPTEQVEVAFQTAIISTFFFILKNFPSLFLVPPRAISLSFCVNSAISKINHLLSVFETLLWFYPNKWDNLCWVKYTRWWLSERRSLNTFSLSGPILLFNIASF